MPESRCVEPVLAQHDARYLRRDAERHVRRKGAVTVPLEGDAELQVHQA